MSGILNSGKLATLLSRLSATRATYLDNLANLNATITSRADATHWTSTRAAKLDYLDTAVSGAGAAAPVTMYGFSTTPTATADDGSFLEIGTGSTSTYNVWTTVVSVTGQGIIQLLSAYQTTNASSLDVSFRLTIDGNVVYTTADAFITGSTTAGLGIHLIGDNSSELTFDAVPFSSSFLVEFRKNTNSAGTVACGSKGRYYKTA